MLHELLCLRGVHARGRLVEQQQGGIGGQRADDLQTALGAVGEGTGTAVGQILHIENAQQLQRALVGGLFLPPVFGKTQDAGGDGVGLLIMQADLDVVLYGQVVEQADVLEGPGDAMRLICSVVLPAVS